MPKRPNPFGDPFAVQYKTHISQKEVDLGVNKEQNMKVVYDRTMALLYGGQKTLPRAHGHDMSSHHEMSDHGMNGQANGHHATNGQASGQGMNNQANGHDMNGHHKMNGHGATNALQHLMNHSQQMTGGQSNSEDMDVDMTDKAELVSGQSYLDSKCRVVNSFPNGDMQSKEAAGCHNNNNISPALVCQMCKQARAFKSRCSFCDKLLCAYCIRKCDNCEDKFCSICSTINYDERYERVFCYSCSSS